MITTYSLHVNELSMELLNFNIAEFNDKSVEIIVTDAVDETEYLIATKPTEKTLKNP